MSFSGNKRDASISFVGFPDSLFLFRYEKGFGPKTDGAVHGGKTILRALCAPSFGSENTRAL